MPNNKLNNRKRKLDLISEIHKLDSDLIPTFLQELDSLPSDFKQDLNNQQRIELITAIKEHYYTFSPSAKNKKFGFLKEFVYKQLFKYLHKQIHFNDYIKSLLVIHDSYITNLLQLCESLESRLSNLQIENTPNKQPYDFQLVTQNKLNSVYEMMKLTIIDDKHIPYSSGDKIYYSQFGEDEWLINNLKLPKLGYFVDIGAADGITFSNTYYFEKIGWNGICFEPNPENYELAKKFRKNVIPFAVSSGSGSRTFCIDSSSPDWSHLVPVSNNQTKIKTNNHNISVKAVSLRQIVEENNIKQIDILSIDTEGTEIDVLNSFNIRKIAPKIIIVEHLTYGEISQKSEILGYFNDLPYDLIHSTYSNLIFKHNA